MSVGRSSGRRGGAVGRTVESKFGRMSADMGKFRAMSTKFDRTKPGSGPIWAALSRHVCHTWAKFGEHLPNSGELAQHVIEPGQHAIQHAPNSAEVAQVCGWVSGPLTIRVLVCRPVGRRAGTHVEVVPTLSERAFGGGRPGGKLHSICASTGCIMIVFVFGGPPSDVASSPRSVCVEASAELAGMLAGCIAGKAVRMLPCAARPTSNRTRRRSSHPPRTNRNRSRSQAPGDDPRTPCRGVVVQAGCPIAAGPSCPLTIEVFSPFAAYVVSHAQSAPLRIPRAGVTNDVVLRIASCSLGVRWCSLQPLCTRVSRTLLAHCHIAYNDLEMLAGTTGRFPNNPQDRHKSAAVFSAARGRSAPGGWNIRVSKTLLALPKA